MLHVIVRTMKTSELQKYIGQKIPGTHLTLLEDLGVRTHRSRKRRLVRTKCDCGAIAESIYADIGRGKKTCGQQKICPFARALAGSGADSEARKKGRKEFNKKQRERSVLLENKEHNFCLIKATYNLYIKNAKKRKLEWYLTPEFIEQLWIEQGGKCKITGIPLTCGTTYKNHTWSLDRIDNSKPYTKDNVQIVSKTYNMVKATRTDEEMQLIAYLVSQNIPYEKLRIYNSMTLQQISNILKDVTKTKRK